jgi:hypothetical protein
MPWNIAAQVKVDPIILKSGRKGSLVSPSLPVGSALVSQAAKVR